MPYPTLETLLTKLSLALYASDRRVEKLPVIRTWEPSQVVTLTTYKASGWPCAITPGAGEMTRYEGI